MSQTSRPIRGLHLKQESYRSRLMRTELGDQQYRDGKSVFLIRLKQNRPDPTKLIKESPHAALRTGNAHQDLKKSEEMY